MSAGVWGLGFYHKPLNSISFYPGNMLCCQVRAPGQPLRPLLADLQPARAPGDPGQRRRAGPGADRPGRPGARVRLGLAAQGAAPARACVTLSFRASGVARLLKGVSFGRHLLNLLGVFLWWQYWRVTGTFA